MTRLQSDNLLYVFNDCRENPRRNMTLRLSADGGKTWPYSLMIDGRDWVSYPDVAQGADGEIYVLYDCARTSKADMRFAVVTEADIMAGKLVSEASWLRGILYTASDWGHLMNAAITGGTDR
jgi:hypothetical protein